MYLWTVSSILALPREGYERLSCHMFGNEIFVTLDIMTAYSCPLVLLTPPH